MITRTLLRLATPARCTRQCHKCKRQHPLSKFEVATPTCTHAPQICKPCLELEIRQHTMHKKRRVVHCADPTCHVVLTGEDVFELTNDLHLSTAYDDHRLSYFLCAGCGRDLPFSSFNVRSKRCRHPPTSCDQCAVAHIRRDANFDMLIRTSCPTPGCDEPLLRADVLRTCDETSNTFVTDALLPLVRAPTCTICCEQLEPFSFRKMTTACQHPSNVCIFCITRFVRNQIHVHRTESISCLHAGCAMPLSIGDVARLTDGRSALALQHIRLRDGVKGRFRVCTRPGCSGGQIVARGADIMTCRTCGAKSCVKHRVPWHAGHSCDEFELKATKEVNAVIHALGEGRIRRCPGCGHGVEKRSGCDHVCCPHLFLYLFLYVLQLDRLLTFFIFISFHFYFIL